MKLTDAMHVVIERAKIVDYLLDAGHPDNGGKAAFFTVGASPRHTGQRLIGRSATWCSATRWCVA